MCLSCLSDYLHKSPIRIFKGRTVNAFQRKGEYRHLPHIFSAEILIFSDFQPFEVLMLLCRAPWIFHIDCQKAIQRVQEKRFAEALRPRYQVDQGAGFDQRLESGGLVDVAAAAFNQRDEGRVSNGN